MKEPKTKLKRRERSELKGRMGNFLMFLPNMVMLLGRLLTDVRVPIAEAVNRSIMGAGTAVV